LNSPTEEGQEAGTQRPQEKLPCKGCLWGNQQNLAHDEAGQPEPEDVKLGTKLSENQIIEDNQCQYSLQSMVSSCLRTDHDSRCRRCLFDSFEALGR
jgi:hypothetical protein